ncbi:hypothetical protein O9929_21120 [Vibrio lentus]|nr:hypothetical protein [Vibrio lentus]
MSDTTSSVTTKPYGTTHILITIGFYVQIQAGAGTVCLPITKVVTLVKTTGLTACCALVVAVLFDNLLKQLQPLKA